MKGSFSLNGQMDLSDRLAIETGICTRLSFKAIAKKLKRHPDDITLLMNHINSVRRPGLGWKCPYELVDKDDGDFKALMDLLKMHLIPPDEVHLMPDLFIRK